MSVAPRACRRLTAGAFVGAIVLTVSTGPAAADRAPKPPVTYTQTVRCVGDQAPPTTVANGVGWAQRQLQYTSAWKFSEGRGVKVAVIDTGVTPGPAFGSRLSGLADLVVQHDRLAPGPGLRDCDGHGTLVAGIIAAGADGKSGFAGVAPEADILSIRQSSNDYADKSQQDSGDGEAKAAGTPDSLASAIDYAVDRGANVINVSEADCQPAGNLDEARLRSAVLRAVAKNVVVVVAAGNLSSSGSCTRQNTPGSAPHTEAAPANIDSSGVLTVGAVDRSGVPSSFSLAGPWVDVAAPGSDIIATNPFPGGSGQVDHVTTQAGSGSIQGTSFAAPYVAGVAALVRAADPELNAAQVVRRIESTAAHPAAPGGRTDFVGYGVVDPVAAVSAVLADNRVAARRHPAALTDEPARAVSHHSRDIALWGLCAVAIAVAVLFAGVSTARSRRSQSRVPVRR